MTDKTVDDRSDGYVSIEISEDKMEARASFFPSSGKGRNLEMVQAESALKANTVSHGVDTEAISNAIKKCNDEQMPVKDIQIAQGTKPIKASPAHINLKPDFFNRSKTVIKKDGSVDHKASSPFLMVKKGEVVGRIYSYRPGKDGTDVTGNPIPFKNKDMQIFRAGENLEEKEGFLVSSVFGRFLIEGDLISVTELLEIATDVDYHTGNVAFAGDVIVDGVIQDGFKVAAGGNIRCKKLIKNSEVLSRGNLQLDLGVKGRGNALVRINGTITAKFIEQAAVESLSGITVSTSILSSKISTLGALVMGQKGTIVTSEIIAEKGLDVYNLGRENCAPSTVICGVSFVEQRKLEHLKSRNEVLADKVSALERRSKPPEDLIAQMKKACEHQEKEIAELEKSICTFEDARIKVHGTLFAGTEIRICKYRKKIEKDEQRVVLFLNKEKLVIESEPLV